MITPGVFNQNLYYYPKLKNTRLHHEVQDFLSFSTENLIKKYCVKNPECDEMVLKTLLQYRPQHFFWSGVDLFSISENKMLVLETNSCPSGQKSMPQPYPGFGYALLMSRFLELSNQRTNIPGVLAVIYDKNIMEVSGYAKQLANLSGETVHFVNFSEENENPDSAYYWKDQILHIFCKDTGIFLPVRSAFRYVTQKPWTKIPIRSKTFIFNSVLSCLAGGRNKLIAHKAYEKFNAEFASSGFQIRTPQTLCDVHFSNISSIVTKMNYRAVIKVPYSNAGQGVFTIHSKDELTAFLTNSALFTYQSFIIQELITPILTGSQKSEHKYVSDIRFMTFFDGTTFTPLSIFARKATVPYSKDLSIPSRDIYLTNLSEKIADGWTTQSERLVLVDTKEFECLNISIDNLIDGYFQSVFATIAIDKMASDLSLDGQLDMDKFREQNNDPVLISEIL